MTTEIATRSNGAAPDAAVMEKVIATGDLEALSPAQRVQYYEAVCTSIGLNPLTQPFAYIKLNGKLTLYATRAATDQIRALRHVSLSIEDGERIEDVYRVKVRATLPDGRSDMSTGAVGLGGLKGEALANALMKAETKAKRRATLSICGLGWLDESEVGSIPNAPLVEVDHATGEIVQPAQPAPVIRMVDPATAEVEMVRETPTPPSLDIAATLTYLQKLPPAEAYNRQQRDSLKRLCDERLPAEAARYGLELPAREAGMDPAAWAAHALLLLAERDDSQPF
jgi:hypothetical protein